MSNKNTIEATVISNTKVAKKAIIKKATKKVAEKMSTDLVVIKKVEKIKTNKTTQLLETLIKVSGASRENVIAFLMQNLATRKEVVKLQEFFTQLIVKVASGELVIANENRLVNSQIFVEQMASNFGFDKQNFEKFVIQTLASKAKKVSINTFFKDLFFKASMNADFANKISEFKRF